MPGRTPTIAAVSGLAAGIALTMAAVDGITIGNLPDVLVEMVVRFFPLVLVTVVSLAALRRWIASHDEDHRRQLADLVAYRQEMGEEFERRSKELAQREERVNRHSALNQGQYRTLVDQLREARQERDEALRQRDALQEDFNVLAAEYNGLVLGEIDAGAATFSPRRRTRPSAGRDRRRERGTTDPPSVGHIGSQQQPEPEHHARPAEG
ncbi:hypothetical protein [Streptomyces variegatus]|uniref:hypothetical protein n=1 Tax=Streptomyces variegatus TaxID=284040 RepID=UPI003C2DD2F9